jgi:hypothetical protein
MYELIKKARRREAEKRLRLDRWVREGAEKTRQEDIFFIITWQMHFFKDFVRFNIFFKN